MKEYETKTETLYNHYVKWCTERDRIIPLSENVFGSKMVEHGIQKKRKRVKGEGHQQYFYVPVVLTHVLRGEKGQGDILSTLEEKSAAYEMAVSDK